jgi:DNA repair protein SbcC/Rad50
MITRLFQRSALHEHVDPAQRVQGVAQLPADSDELARVLVADPSPEVRIAAARHCRDFVELAAALGVESDPAVRTAIASALATALAETADGDGARAVIEGERCPDPVRADVARQGQDPQRCRIAIAAIRDEALLVEIAHAATLAETRMAAAERVVTPEGLKSLAAVARNKDHGVARFARQRTDAIVQRQDQAAAADAILAELEALAGAPGPILTPVVELNRRWEALDLAGDTERLARCDAARQALQARFDRENDEQRSRVQFERRLRDWIGTLEPAATADALAASRTELAALRDEAQARGDAAAIALLDQAAQRIDQWERQHQALVDAEALVVEAEQLAAGTSIDHAKLPERWQALDRSMRTPALTRRFEAALIAIEQRRLTQMRVAQQEASAARQRVHDLLHTAEQALAAGQLQAARAAADEIRTVKAGAGPLPKPTTQRLGRVVQQLTELERWESFGQHQARIGLCERAEALAAQTLDARAIATEVPKLREEWKALDQQHAGVPKHLWDRFDRACEKAYAPAARHFAELAAQRKEARKQREEFIAAAAAHAPTLLGEPRDWRAIERWLRETDHTWHEGPLGSVEPGAWKKLDARMKATLAPLRDALGAAREQAKGARQALIAEVTALAARAQERDAPSQVKAIQARWQEQAKALALAQRDERALWDQFRGACDAVFTARQAKRKQDDERKHEGHRALEDVCTQLEQLAQAPDSAEPDVRRALRDLQDKWRKQAGGTDPALRRLESRFRSAKTAVEAMLSARARSREAAVWQTLAEKERLCETLDRLALAGTTAPDAAATVASTQERWAALPSLPAAWEKPMVGRRDSALRALADGGDASAYAKRIEAAAAARAETLLELEIALGLDSPPECQPQRLVLQVKLLKNRFSGSAGDAGTPNERLLAWCALPGVVDERDRKRCERILAALERGR